MRRASLTLFLVLTTGTLGCSGGPGGPGSGGGGGGGGGGSGGQALDPDAEVFAGLPTGAASLQAICSRGNSDSVAAGLCASPSPKVASLADLQHAVGLFAGSQPPQFALTGHSSSLVARSVSAINPRAIMFTAPSQAPTTQQNDGSFVADPGFVAMGFVRGEQFVEVVGHDPQKDELHFYLMRFTQACNDKGCTSGDLLTPAVESNWNELTVYEDSDLKDTIFDCLHCHQPDGPSTRKMLRMQERRAPWTHWFRNNQNEPGGESLLADFRGAHGAGEPYAAIPGNLFDTPRSDPLVLEALVDNNSVSPQPNEFSGARIESEVAQSAPDQPAVNDPMGASPTWNKIHQLSLTGQAIPVPYHDVKITDASKLASMSAAYRQVVSGAQPVSSLPDIRDVLLDEGLADMGFVPEPSLDGNGILVAMCQRCHNATLDQTLTRARFDVTNLASMSRAEKDLAIARLQMSAAVERKVMPPARFGTLSAAQIALAVTELMK